MPETNDQTRSAESDKQDVQKKYQDIREYEHHFNNIELEIRKLASVWLLAALGAIAYLVKGADTSTLLMKPGQLAALVCLMGNLGLLVLWILDQMVYHRLLNAVFLLGLRMEYKFKYLPPVRTLMMLYSLKRGMAGYLRLYFFIPMFVLASIALYFSPWKGIACAVIPLLAYWKSKKMESYEEIAVGFDDPVFVRYLAEKKYESTLSGH